MPRSPSDATRFTATGPYVSAKPQTSSTEFSPNPSAATPSASSGSQLSFGAPAREGETPLQKIARLRAAAAAAKQGKESQLDQVVRVGRTWADRAHRVTAISLIGLTIISAAVATAGITDMLLHNRRRRNEWLAEQQAKSALALVEAKKARSAGVATEDQVLLINRERAADEAAAAKKNKPGVFKQASGWLFSGLSSEEQKGGRLGAAAVAGGAVSRESANESAEVQDHKGVLKEVGDKLGRQRRGGEKVEEALRPLGGPLDRQAQVAVDVATDTGKSWTSWVTGR